MNSTIVTALYNIGREEIDGRKFEDYIEWTNKTLSLKSNFILYTDRETSNRLDFKNKNVKVIIQELSEIPLISLRGRIDTILRSEKFKRRMADISRIECREPLYTIIQYSKFNWLKESIQLNPFNSSYFFWMDAGCSRFFPEGVFENEFPNLNFVPKDKFFIQGNVNTGNIPVDDNYIWKSDCQLVGTFFGGNSDVTCKISDFTLEFLNKKMLDKDIINNEQIALAYVALNNLNLFDIFIKTDGTHLPILKWLL